MWKLVITIWAAGPATIAGAEDLVFPSEQLCERAAGQLRAQWDIPRQTPQVLRTACIELPPDGE